jgi:ribosomal protein S18 acetylase RimI-like enzyme
VAFRIRAARASDQAAILAIQIASWRDTYRGVMPDVFLDQEMEAALTDFWQGVFGGRRRAGTLAVAAFGRDVVGFIAAWQVADLAYIDSLHVRPGMRRAGIGRALLGFAARRLAGQGCVGASMYIPEANRAAARLFARLGGQIGTAEPRLVFGRVVAGSPVLWPDITTLLAAVAPSR